MRNLKAVAPHEIEYYYDAHPTKEDLMGESASQFDLAHYLILVLREQYRAERLFVIGNLNIYQTANPKEYPLAPDVALFRVAISEQEKRGLRSWKMLQANRPAPSVVFEIASKETWKEDLRDKPAQYAAMGVKEYFAYDPNEPQLWRPRQPNLRLRGWRNEAGRTRELIPDERSWLWSDELDSWLVSDNEYLRLYDSQLEMRLTGEEAEARAKEKAWAKLRELNIDPEKL